MKTLIKSAKIIDKQSKFHNKVADVLIANGKIKSIGKVSESADQVIEAKGMLLTIGWFDMRANFCDPGLEHKEDMMSGLEAAAAGGFTGVAVLPNTKPVLQSKNDMKYIYSKAMGNLVDAYPIGAVTIDAKGEDFTEMIDLHEAGAIAFSDGEEPIWQSDILMKTLQYLQKFNGLLINKPEDKRLNIFGQMNEGISSTQLGMKGMPKLGEGIMIDRDLSLLGYAGGRLHFSQISTADSVKKIKEAKKKGLNVTCDIASFQSLFTDGDLDGFDTNYKVNPPFRNKEDNKALVNGLKDGTIDVIVSAHTPHDEESKKLEFDLADFGISSIQTVAANISELSNQVDIELLLEKVTATPRSLLGLEIPSITEGSTANLTLFAPDVEWVLNASTNKSKSEYSPFYCKNLKGKAVAVFNNNQVQIN